MKKIMITLLMASSVALTAQALPFDFESSTSGMVGYDGASFTIVANPSSVGNSSANVAKIVKVNAADLWAGGKITSVSSLNFTSASSSVLSMKVYTTQPVGTVLKVKLESPYTSEVDAVTTVSGAWETLTFDFGIPAPSGSVDLVIMPQPFTPGGGNTFYIDDIEQVAGVIATQRLGLPVTFESGTTARHFFDFESAIMTSLPNPYIDVDNGSANVGKIVRYLGAPYGGSKITFTNNLDFVNSPVITMKVWTSAPIGTNVTLKAEKPFWGEELSVQTTKTEEWETLSFDFTNAPPDMPTLALLFDFVAGSTNVGDGSATSTFYFDEIKYANVPLGGIEESKELFSVYPNPTSDKWTVRNPSSTGCTIQIFDLKGQQLYQVLTSSQSHTIDATDFAAGIYLAKIQSGANEQTVRLVKH
ncbi:MAG: T9SS type A sorting domain-containing protein [Bacteroidetes bacterium]|nr:T9SS type A sorting domain-containing protein [Bacteroidota bacterium]